MQASLRSRAICCLKQRIGYNPHGSSWNCVRHYKVTVVGAGGGIGQPLSLLLKQNPLITQLSLHDANPVKGIAVDLSHVCTHAEVAGFQGREVGDMMNAMKDSHVVVVPAGLPRAPGMTREQLLGSNADVVSMVAFAVSNSCPKALVAVITNPINALLPVLSEVLKTQGNYDPNRIFGVTTLDVIRACTFVAKETGLDPAKVSLPVIGGHAGNTILPIISQCQPKFQGSEEQVKKLTHAIQEAGTEVVNAKDGKGSATLSMAFAGAYFVNALLRGLKGEPDVIECAYVASDVTKAPYFATPLHLGPDGIKHNLGLPKMNDLEKESLKKMLPELINSINSGVEFIKKQTKRRDQASQSGITV